MANRIVDGYNASTKTIYEAKYGYMSLTSFIRSEIERDLYLLQTKQVKHVEWHFFVRVITGKGGPSDSLLIELLNAGFDVFFH